MKKFEVPPIYRSNLITAIKEKRKQQDRLKKDFAPTTLSLGPLTILLARHFGFCYGVENAIEIAFKTIAENPGKRIFLLSEMIHNPMVNHDLHTLGVRFLQDTKGKQLIPFEDITHDDIVLIPAFGTTLSIEARLKEIGVSIEKYNTTCPFVEKVWNRGEQISKKGYTVIIHGKPNHEETRATFSHASHFGPALVINDMEEAKSLAKYINGEQGQEAFEKDFEGRYTKGFQVNVHLKRIGVTNQTTQLATDTQAISDFLKQAILSKYSQPDSFADNKDTLCYATNDNQEAVFGLLQKPSDLAIVIGGYNSSNTSHLVEICEKELPTYFIDSADRFTNKETIVTCDWRTKEIKQINPFIQTPNPTISITSGASCPDSLVEGVIRKLGSFYMGEAEIDLKIAELAAKYA